MSSAAALRLNPGLRLRRNVVPGALTVLGVCLLNFAAARNGLSASSAHANKIAPDAAPVAPPLLLRDVNPLSAMSINRSIPLAAGANPAAKPFAVQGGEEAYARALECLTSAIYYEAGNEAPEGQRAVAQVVLNRARHPAFAPGVCGVVYQGSTRQTGCQFTFTCDGSMRRLPSRSGWARALAVAKAALAGDVYAPVGHATHYHADYVVPYWATSLAKNAVQGRHIFYRWPGWWGQPPAFRRRHLGIELDPRLLRYAALGGRAPHLLAGQSSLTGDGLRVGIDSRAELISIISWLAAEPVETGEPSAYEALVKEYFSGFNHHVAVEIYRQLAAANPKFDAEAAIQLLMHYSPPPKIEAGHTVTKELVSIAGGKRKLVGFITALREFVKHSDFESFTRKQLPFYAELEDRTRKEALAVFADAQSGSAMPVNSVRLVVAPLLKDVTTVGCQPLPKGKSEPYLLISKGAPAPPALATDRELKSLLVSASSGACGSKA